MFGKKLVKHPLVPAPAPAPVAPAEEDHVEEDPRIVLARRLVPVDGAGSGGWYRDKLDAPVSKTS